jgi:1,4-alpha-glucan branching enzyme
VRAYLPAAREARLADGRVLGRVGASDFFELAATTPLDAHPRLVWTDDQGRQQERVDPYTFSPTLSPADLGMLAAGNHVEAWKMLGAHPATFDGIQGVRFAVWAPNAERVSLVGPFCDWDGRRLPMRVLGGSGVWELFLPGLPLGTLYKFELRNRDSGELLVKTDPYAFAMEMRPATAGIVTDTHAYAWRDGEWLRQRAERDWLRAPLSIYEVHLGSWNRHADGGYFSYRELTTQLLPYVKRLGFTHIELLPITEHPLDDSWGYQTTGYFAPSSRFGPPEDLKHFIDSCHGEGIGVLLDWVPAHFPRDAHALARFDGTALYEYADPRKGEHADWGTLVFNYERHEVRNFLLASACYWLEHFHLDGLRVDAVASMLYLDYARGTDFVRNRHGGRENLEAVDFLRALNTITHARTPGTLIMAEESTDWPMVSRPVDSGGLGFSMKWNMGWMHDTLGYFGRDPIHRRHHQDELTFAMMYAYTENFILPLSHDEVVHGKGSLIGRMPGDEWQQFANLRAYFAYMYAHPGKKLLFMGGEFAQWSEWNHQRSLDWNLLEYSPHRGMQTLIRQLNHCYRQLPALYQQDFVAEGFEWIDCNDAEHSIYTWLRRARDGTCMICVCNFTPVVRQGYRLGVPHAGTYKVLLNTDSAEFGGSNMTATAAPKGKLETQNTPAQDRPQSVQLTLPPLATLWLAPEQADG